ncbi:uncharacterized protein PV09_06402 [Verruconis gallopava]|uniref:DUF6536 domain-containing protein n=1 Tax=Verruconis gallopava TaxID=253628 RepID=A0A0D2A6P5_9PEZI|nr:uncharacterized protein PV09_06402 [Verruconis gallopava]KIW02250.1 hypothetical protein PV09_06402 [Verruconis gallopava]
MEPQYGLVEDGDEFDGAKDRNTYRLISFASLKTLRRDDCDSRKRKKGSYTALDDDQAPRRSWKIGCFKLGSGWRFAVFGCAMSCTVSFALNLLLVIVIVAKYGVDSSGRLQMYEGDCVSTEKLNTVVHIFINAMSTVLLSSSNYVMQCICAVTREEVDAAHAGKRRSRWAEIGVPSMFNMCLIAPRRVLLWYLLMFSSLPLHLFYNSAVFSSTAMYGSPILSVNSNFMDMALDPARRTQLASNFTDLSNNNETIFLPYFNTRYNMTEYVKSANNHEPYLVNGSVQYLLSQVDSFKEMDPRDCIDAYSQTYQTTMGGLFLVLDVPPNNTNTNFTDAVVFDRMASWGGYGYCDMDHYAWICDQTHLNLCWLSTTAGARSCEDQLPALVKENVTNWRPNVPEYAVSKCYAQTLPQKCKLQASIHLVAVVVFLNAMKAAIMYLAVRWMDDAPLLTIGDAVASFLERPDPYTADACLLTRRDARREITWIGKISDRPRPFDGARKRWYSGSGLIRQALIVFLILAAIILVAILYVWGKAFAREQGAKTDLASLWKMGMGVVNPATTIVFSSMPSSGAAGLVWSAFVANVPQLILSLIYFAYNGILTAFFLGAEWQSYMRERKGLRVSDNPSGDQRSTYFLQLPYRAAIPLMVASGALHWLVSQSIFLVDIENYIYDSTVNWQSGGFPYTQATATNGVTLYSIIQGNTLTCGYSLIPMIFVLIIAVVMLLVLIVLGVQKFKTSMPVAASNSLAIAAACHLTDDEFNSGDAARKKLKWGAVRSSGKGNEVGHCCFSSLPVEQPKVSALYA